MKAVNITVYTEDNSQIEAIKAVIKAFKVKYKISEAQEMETLTILSLWLRSKTAASMPPKEKPLKLTYFKDTDTLLINFNNNEITDTKDLNENVLVETDKNGNVVSMTIEHAQQQAGIANFSFNQVENTGAD